MPKAYASAGQTSIGIHPELWSAFHVKPRLCARAIGQRVTLHVKTKSSAVDAARLALDLEHAGFAVEVADAAGR